MNVPYLWYQESEHWKNKDPMLWGAYSMAIGHSWQSPKYPSDRDLLSMFALLKKGNTGGSLVGSWSRGCEFKPHVAYRDYLNQWNFKKRATVGATDGQVPRISLLRAKVSSNQAAVPVPEVTWGWGEPAVGEVLCWAVGLWGDGESFTAFPVGWCLPMTTSALRPYWMGCYWEWKGAGHELWRAWVESMAKCTGWEFWVWWMPVTLKESEFPHRTQHVWWS